MSRVKILSDEVVNQIAAGEVVERPASVVKELLENALDAGARTVRVAVKGAGVKLIRVEDDGEGMSREDLLLALERHSTSKLEKASDLERVSTFGFRGEALPSIAAVSEMEITTRRPDELGGLRVTLSGGVIRELVETGAPPGTVVEVKRLFFNTPPRRKFLKSPATESGHIFRETAARALAYPEAAFSLREEDRDVFSLPLEAGLVERLAGLRGGDASAPFLSVSARSGGLAVSGLVSSPEDSVGYRGHLYLFVNRRPVSDRVIFSAVMKAFSVRLARGRYPSGAVFVEAEPGLVDFNVHPAKKEVKFSRPGKVHDLVKEAVESALRGVPPVRSFYPLSSPGGPPSAREPAPLSPAQSELELPSSDERPSRPLAPSDRILGQLRGSYLVVETAEGVLVVDQHAAHERILYEEFRRGLLDAPPDQQALLSPITVELDPVDAPELAARIPLLRSLGIELEPFGRNTFAVTSLPAFLGTRVRREIVADFLAGMGEWGDGPEPREEAIKSLACREAVKARQNLSAPAGTALWERLRRCEDPSICPHGRPVSLKLGWEEIERRFGRR